eukprot:scaffold12312_cov248-Ochromonas_danica.AAC.8
MATQNGSFCLFLGDLSLFCAEKDILSAFSVFGRVTNVRIKRSSENKKHLLYGFVEYSSAAEAIRAMQAMNGAMFLGRILRVRWASNKFTKMSGGNEMMSQNSGGNRGPSVFVVFLVYNKQLVANEMTLRPLFENFGVVEDVVVKQSKVDPSTGLQKGYAFVQYTCDLAGVNAAYTAVSHMDNAIVDNVEYKCEVSHSTEELRRQLLPSSPSPSSLSGGSEGYTTMREMVHQQPQRGPSLMDGSMQFAKQTLLPAASIPSMISTAAPWTLPAPAYHMVQSAPTAVYSRHPMYSIPSPRDVAGMPYYFDVPMNHNISPPSYGGDDYTTILYPPVPPSFRV